MKKLFLIITALVILALDLTAIRDILFGMESDFKAEWVMLAISAGLLYALVHF
ncbi:MAG: hypothetical protein R2769_11825 [Saprospiraceae bacterium]